MILFYIPYRALMMISHQLVTIFKSHLTRKCIQIFSLRKINLKKTHQTNQIKFLMLNGCCDLYIPVAQSQLNSRCNAVEYITGDEADFHRFYVPLKMLKISMDRRHIIIHLGKTSVFPYRQFRQKMTDKPKLKS